MWQAPGKPVGNGDASQLVEFVHKAQSRGPQTRIEPGSLESACNPVTGGVADQKLEVTLDKFEVSLGCLRPCLEREEELSGCL